jgi:ferredoxin
VTLAQLNEAAKAVGLAFRGGFVLTSKERVGPLAPVRSVALYGSVGAGQWPAFAASPEAADGRPHPLDRWSRRVLTALAERFGATALFPFEGPPYWPFQRWAQRAEPLSASPVGMFIHPRYGLAHSYRGALGFAEPLAFGAPEEGPNPCDACAGRPCLSACPVGAFTERGYDVAACAGWLKSAGKACMTGGCLARRACPVGPEFAQSPEQAGFHMRAFLAARS